MIPKVVEVKHLEGYKLWLRFQDGLSGTVDLVSFPKLRTTRK